MFWTETSSCWVIFRKKVCWNRSHILIFQIIIISALLAQLTKAMSNPRANPKDCLPGLEANIMRIRRESKRCSEVWQITGGCHLKPETEETVSTFHKLEASADMVALVTTDIYLGFLIPLTKFVTREGSLTLLLWRWRGWGSDCKVITVIMSRVIMGVIPRLTTHELVAARCPPYHSVLVPTLAAAVSCPLTLPVGSMKTLLLKIRMVVTGRLSSISLAFKMRWK